MASANKLSLLSEAAAFVECTGEDSPNLVNGASAKRCESKSSGAVSHDFNKTHDNDFSRLPKTETHTDSEMPVAIDKQSQTTRRILETQIRAPHRNTDESAFADTCKQDNASLISLSCSLAHAHASSSNGPLLSPNDYLAYLARLQAQAGSLAVTSDGVILSPFTLLATPYSIAAHPPHPQNGPALQRPAVLPILGVLPSLTSQDPCTCRARQDERAELKMQLVEFENDAIGTEQRDGTRLRSASEVVTESLSSRCVQPPLAAQTHLSNSGTPLSNSSASATARELNENELLNSQSQLSRPYKKRKIVIRAFSDVTPERRTWSQTPMSEATQADAAAETSNKPEPLPGDERAAVRSPVGYHAYGPSRRRLLPSSTSRSSGPCYDCHAALRIRSQSPYSLSSALSGTSSPSSSLSGSCANILDAVASGTPTSPASVPHCHNGCNSLASGDTFNTLKAFRGLSIGSRVSSSSNTPVSVGAPSSSGYASELPSVSGCFASPSTALPCSKINRSVVIMNVDPDEQLEEHFARSLYAAHDPLVRCSNSPVELAGRSRLPMVPKSERLVDQHIRKSLVQRAGSAASRTHKVTVKRTESCPLTLKRTAPASPPLARAACANVICFLNESDADPSPQVALKNETGPEAEDSVDVDEHFRRALGTGWSNSTKLHVSDCADDLLADAVQVTHL